MVRHRSVMVCTSMVWFVLVSASQSWAAEAPRILFLSKSSGFEHSSIRRSDDQPSHVDKVLTALAKRMGAQITTTKDAGLINSDRLDDFDVVIFYTTGDLTKPGGDKNPPMSETGLEELQDWIRAGGGFIGYHCATDTFGHHWGKADLPYIGMIGAEFRAHGRQFEGTVTVVDPKHPTMANVPARWPVYDEWYLFKNVNEPALHVLALMDPGPERDKQEMYDVAPYPVIWCRSYGEGRVYYNAMGHREDVWDDATFQKTVQDAIRWAAGDGELAAEPNYRMSTSQATESGEE